MTKVFELIGFDPGNRGALESLGFSHDAISEIFLGPPSAYREVEIVAEAPEYMRAFCRREYVAGDFTPRAIRLNEIRVPDPWAGQVAATRSGFVPSDQGKLPYELLPLYYQLVDAHGREFWLVSYWPYGRITHIILIAENAVICDLDRSSAPLLAEQLTSHIDCFRRAAESRSSQQRRPRVIGILDFLNNYAHQLMNQLSGLQRIIEEVGLSSIDEFWLSGIEFFAPAERLFPEIASMVRRFNHPWDMYAKLIGGNYLPLRVGSNIFRRTLAARIRESLVGLTAGFDRISPERKPLVAVTLRTLGRKCLNLVDVVGETITHLMKKYPNLGVILDGFVIPDSQIGSRSSLISDLPNEDYKAAVMADMALADGICNSLPRGVIVRNLVGTSMSQSLLGISYIDAYLSHVGTLQHKLSFFTQTRGVVHGPKAQLATPDAGHYQADSGFAPMFLDPNSVQDVPSSTWRGSGFYDYVITNIDDLMRKLSHALETGSR
jgi:hypothetical protein